MQKIFMEQFSATSYAILGQLALRSWSAYDLIQEMKRNFHYFWPRAESGLYAELKRLKKLDCVHTTKRKTGKRQSTVYAISPKGKTVLETWLGTEPAEFKLEFEGLLRVFLSRFGAPETLKKTLLKVEEDAGVLSVLATNIAREYLTGTAPFQEEIEVRTFVFDFLVHYADLYKEWVVRTREELQLREGRSADERKKMALELMRKNIAKLNLPV